MDEEDIDRLCPDTGKLGDCWWHKLGMWALDTGNANSWRSFNDSYGLNSMADVMFGQEAKVFTET